MPRTVIITPNVRQRLKRYIYNITINPSVEPKYKVDTFRRAIDKANMILTDLYCTLSNEFVLYKPTQFNVLGKSYGYRQYQYKDKSSKTVWLFGCDTTPSFNFVMIMQNSKLCLSHIVHQGNLIIENKQYNKMKNTRNRVRLTESQLHQVIKESVKRVLRERFLTADEIEDHEDLGVTSDEYNQLIDYDKSFQQRDNGRINPTFSSYMQYCDRLPDTPSERWKKLDMENDFRTMESPSNADIDTYIEDNNWKNDTSGDCFKRDFIKGAKPYDGFGGRVNPEVGVSDALQYLGKSDKERSMEKRNSRMQLSRDASKADKRPLHRKGSLNRAMDESIRRAIRKVLR